MTCHSKTLSACVCLLSLPISHTNTHTHTLFLSLSLCVLSAFLFAPTTSPPTHHAHTPPLTLHHLSYSTNNKGTKGTMTLLNTATAKPVEGDHSAVPGAASKPATLPERANIVKLSGAKSSRDEGRVFYFAFDSPKDAVIFCDLVQKIVRCFMRARVCVCVCVFFECLFMLIPHYKLASLQKTRRRAQVPAPPPRGSLTLFQECVSWFWSASFNIHTTSSTVAAAAAAPLSNH